MIAQCGSCTSSSPTPLARRACRRRNSCAATGRRSRCWCARAIADVVPPIGRAALFALAAPRRRRVAAGRAGRGRLAPAPRAVRAPRPAAAGEAGLDAAGAGRGPALPSGARAAGALPLRARRAARRPDDVARPATAAASARTSTPTTCSCCRSQGRRRWRIGRARDPRLARRRAAEDARATSRPSTSGCSSPATCSTCRRAGRTTASPMGECMTCSIGFRAPAARALGARCCCSALIDAHRASADDEPPPTATRPGGDGRAGPHSRGAAGLRRGCGASPAAATRGALERALGEVLSEPKPGVVVRASPAPLPAPARRAARSPHAHDLRRAPRLHQRRVVSRRAAATRALMRRLADARRLDGGDAGRLSGEARGAARAMARGGLAAAAQRRRGRAMNDDAISEAHRVLATRGECLDAIRAALADAARAGCREIVLCDADFADWPLGERAVVESLTRWALRGRRLTLFAAGFEDAARSAIRASRMAPPLVARGRMPGRSTSRAGAGAEPAAGAGRRHPAHPRHGALARQRLGGRGGCRFAAARRLMR